MYKLVVMGFSAGGLSPAQRILKALPADYPLPVSIVTHLPPGDESNLVEILSRSAALPVVMAVDKAEIRPGRIYIAPPDYHLLVEKSGVFALSVDPPVKSVRPSIDVLFQSAAEAFEKDLIAVVLSGANSDGLRGIVSVKELGGVTIVLDPTGVEFYTLPTAVLETVDVDYVANTDEIISLLRAVQETP